MNKVKITIISIATFFIGQLFGETMDESNQCVNHVIITGTAKELKLIRENIGEIAFEVPIDIRFVNCSKEPILIFQDQDQEKRGYPWGGGSTFYNSKESVGQDKYLCGRGIWPSESRDSETWQEIRKVLNASFPPNEFIRVINPGESWDYEFYQGLSFEKRSKPINSGCKSWDVIKEIDTLWLQKEFIVWPNMIERNSKSSKYGLSLRKKWKEKSYLLIDNIISEPIPINLREAINPQ